MATAFTSRWTQARPGPTSVLKTLSKSARFALTRKTQSGVCRRSWPHGGTQRRARHLSLQRRRQDLAEGFLQERQRWRDRPRDGSDKSAHSIRQLLAGRAQAMDLRERRSRQRHLEVDRRRRYLEGASPTIRASPRVSSDVLASPFRQPTLTGCGLSLRLRKAASSAPMTPEHVDQDNGDNSIKQRAWYYSQVFADPKMRTPSTP